MEIKANINDSILLVILILHFSLAQLGKVMMGKLKNMEHKERGLGVFSSIAKNSSMTLGVALLVFPNELLIHLIMVIQPLIELPAMLLITRVLLIIHKRSFLLN
ncbi:MAG: hypothetical protein H2212_08995 [Ruminococcus sp.]|jgi:ACR3 family arsenite efflux pump ArsB|nr:hypothetical protein [Ruminococcus sp.]